MLKKYMTIMAISLIAFSSCQDQISIPGGDGETQAPGNEEIIYPIEKTFYSVDGFSKTLLNDTQVLWETGDMIKILWDGGWASAVAAPFNSNANAEFRTRVEDGAETFFAVHPYSEGAFLADDKVTVTVPVPAVQDGTFSSASIAAAKAGANNHLAFKHMVSFVEFTIDKCGTLTFSCGPDIAGEVSATFGERGALLDVTQNGTDDVITVDIPCSGTYYIALLPEVKMDFLSFTLTNGSTTEYILSTKPKTMTRGKLIGLGNITDRFSSKRPLGATTESFEIFEYIF